MKAKEKAIELVSEFKPYADYTECDIFNQVERMHINAKRIALIAVDEILDAITFNMYDEEEYNKVNDYWEQVKKEIEKL
jgi:hypothetical protein